MQEKLNILFLTFQGDTAGSTNSIAFLTKGLAERGHNVYLGIRREALLWQLVEGSKVHRIPMTFNGKFDLTNWKQIKDAVITYKIHLINAQSSYDRYTSIFARIRYRLKCKVIHTRRQMPMSTGGLLQKLFINKNIEGMVAVSQPVSEALINLGVDKDLITVIHNGTPLEKYATLDEAKTTQLKEKFNIQPNDIVIGCVSRMKNQLQIIKALQLVSTPVKMIFCGIEGTDEMNEIIAQYNTAHEIFFEGHVPGEEVLNYYPLFSMKVLASTMEGLSQSLLEAMALGVPVIATAFAGNLDLIKNDENGLLFEDGNIGHIARCINSLIDNEPLRQQLIKQGKETALVKFNIENTISNYEKYFRNLTLL